ncbi:MAG: selenocysteine-specific translation elongation factor [Verrucomicrobia bacterium]|nr:MAG: selenocysteine-specific translation elongation factor [Verrucomicrobiota bacterium]
MIVKHFILATAGHVDHGKSTLVKALTGTNPDRLPEEKARGITIDLGFAHLELSAPPSSLNKRQSNASAARTSDQPSTFSVGIVDVPGHEDFVRNMIAGIGSIDLALLVVAADDGWMPQTEEHLQILSYLGVRRIAVALTKSDLGKIDNVASQIREKLRETTFANAQIIATSARTGFGLEDLKEVLASEFATVSTPRDIGKPRLFVDRAFTLHGIGTVVTGTLAGGQFQRGQNVVIQPQNLSARVRTIQSHNRDLEIAQPGTRTAINLPDVPVGSDGIKRGDVITIANVGAAADIVNVVLERSARLNRKTPAARPLKNGSLVHIHLGTTRVPAKITLLDQDVVQPGQRAVAQLCLDSPILAFVGDRFVVRDSSAQNTIAGGVVLDVDGDRQNFRNAGQTELLRTRAAAIDEVDVCIQSQLTRDGFAQTNTLLVTSHFSADEIANALSRSQNAGGIVLRGKIAANPAYWRDLVARASALIDRAHEKHPEQRGLDFTELRVELNIESDELFAAVVSEMTANGFARAETNIGRNSHRPSLPAEILPAAEKIRAALAGKPFDPPSRKDFLLATASPSGGGQDRHLHQALRFLIEQGEIVEIGDEIVLLRDAVDQMQNLVSEFISTNGSATASQLRQSLGTSRRIIIPFLEYLDRTGVTRRVGDERVLAQKAAVAKLDDAAIGRRS